MRHEPTPPPQPGSVLLGIARHLLDEREVSMLVRPAIADLQHELREADASLAGRVAARWHGYIAFWRLIMMTPIAAFDRPLEDRLLTTIFGRQRVGPLLWLMLPLCAALWPLFAWFGVGTVVAGVLTAIAMRRWHDRHPTTLPARESNRHQAVEINLAAIHVDGNAGGMFFAFGSMAIVVVGLPQFWMLFVIPVVVGAVLAAGMFAWRTSHPAPLTCQNTLLGR